MSLYFIVLALQVFNYNPSHSCFQTFFNYRMIILKIAPNALWLKP
jgi:hypothetical protein